METLTRGSTFKGEINFKVNASREILVFLRPLRHEKISDYDDRIQAIDEQGYVNQQADRLTKNTDEQAINREEDYD